MEKLHARITITDSQGRVFSGTADLCLATGDAREAIDTPNPHVANALPNFELPERRFCADYCSRKSGARKLTLLLAYLCKGQGDRAIPLSEIQSKWQRMTSAMGNFNRAHIGRAKNSGWIDSPRPGEYSLTPLWIEALKNED